MAKKRGLKCPWCFQSVPSINGFRNHIRTKHPHESRREDTAPLPNKLLSNRSNIDDSDGVFEFDGVLADDEFASCVEIVADSDDDSYYSDCGFENEMGGGGIYSSSDDDDDSDDSVDDLSDITYEPSEENDDDDDDDDVMDFVDADVDEGEDDDDATPDGFQYFTPKHVPDDQIPFSENTFAPPHDFTAPSSFVVQLRLMDLFNRNKGSLKMYDELIEILNAYTSSPDFNMYSTLLPRSTFLSKVETVFNTSQLKPTYGAVRLHNNTYATVPVFDVKTMILSIVHDPNLMRAENFATGLDIFTGDVDRKCEDNKRYGEIHTGDAWLPARDRFCGKDGKYMPFGIIIFGDKSHTDLHGSLSTTPITFTATFFNSSVRNNPSCWRPMAYLPNLAHGKAGGGKSRDKVQDEHNCLAYALKSLVELSEAGGIRTVVMGKEVIIKPFIHYFIGDTEGHNKWLGHYTGSKPGMARPYRDCHCTFQQLSSTYPECVYTTAAEFRRGMRTVLHDKKLGMQQLQSMSRHYVNNAMYQTKLPLSNEKHGANKMCPPETLHVMDAGLTIYMQESLQDRTSAGQSREELAVQHVRMFNNVRRNSERDLPRGATRNGLIDSTRCQSSERKGNLFLLLCIANTVDGERILQNELNYSDQQWKQWMELLKLYLALGEWIHDARPKKEVRESRRALSVVIKGIQKFFPRKEDSHGYNIPKMHALAKMPEYMCEFGTGMNFYSGPGEASHKLFVKAPGLKTQRRVAEFASQTAGQYYSVMAVSKVTQYVDIRSTREKARDEHNKQSDNSMNATRYQVLGEYIVRIDPRTESIRLKCAKQNKHVKKRGLDSRLVEVIKQVARENGTETITGYTRATIYETDGRVTKYNAHPYYHGAEWYDWTYVCYHIEGRDGESEFQYYPSKILGFIRSKTGEVQAVVQCSEKPLPWSQLEQKFVCKFDLCSSVGKEQIVPISSLSDPLCVVKDFGGSEDKYMLVLPKGLWSEYYARFVKKVNG